MIKIFIPQPYHSSDQQFFNPILEVFWNDLDETERMRRFGPRFTSFKLVFQPQDADFYLLPLVWNYYVDQKKINLADNINKDAARNQKPLIIFSRGDFTASVPFHNVIIIQPSAYRSRNYINGQHLIAIPPFVGNYLKMYSNGELKIRTKSKKPIIGFCGQASGTIIDYSRRQFYIWLRQIQYRLSLIQWEPPPIEPTRFRNSILAQLSKSKLVETNFLIRIRYRAGYLEAKKDPYHPSRVEFINNIINTDYTVCVRGGGNFSVRFYETLCLGRIPIFFDTDCLLPYQEIIDYKDLCVWISESERDFAEEKIRDFHDSLSPREFQDRQLACRELFLKYLHINGYFHNFHKQFELPPT